MVAYLTKSNASEGFNQVIDFLNGSHIKYALTVNPKIYVSCIKQFWNTVAIKQVNDVTRMQALVDKKKVVVTEAEIREKVFANMRRVGKGFSGVDTPLFEGMLVGQEIEEGGDEKEHVEDVTAGDVAQGDDTAAHGEVPLRIDTSEDTVMDDESNQERITDEMDKDDTLALMDDKEDDKKDEEAKENEPAEVHEVVDVVTTTKLITEVVTAASETITAASAIISAAEPQVPIATITAAPTKVDIAPSRGRKG
nr:hypothetical protein [Tanacetum cinerariifolium]